MANGYRYRVRFEPYQGYHLFRDDISVLLRAISFGRRFSDDQNADYVKHTARFFDAIKSVDAPVMTSAKPLIESDFEDLSDQPIFKYVSDSTWRYISEGSFQFGTAQFYRETSNINAQDRKEGASTFHLAHENDQLNVSIVSGNNCALFCGTSLLTGNAHTRMLEKFGQRRIVIEPLKDFIAIVKKHIGSFSARVHDVAYTDLKNFTAEVPGIEQFRTIAFASGSTDLSKSKLKKINREFFATFYKFGFMPSLFAKPTAYDEERERRIVFETLADMKTPTIIVNDKSLLDCVKLAI